MVTGIIAKFLGKLWDESQRFNNSQSMHLDVCVKEKDNAFLTALQFMNTGISTIWTWWVKCATSSFSVHRNTRDEAWEIILCLTSQL